jgi:hypothetical protein
MNVQMRNSLTCRRPIIDPDVVPIGAELPIQLALRRIQQRKQSISFGHVK